MSITGTLSNALSGLVAQGRAAELVSTNVANAGTAGYGRREIDLVPRYLGAGQSSGVRVTGVRREVDMGIVQNRRLSDAEVGYRSTVADFQADFQDLLGTPDDTGSLSGRLAKLEATLIEATSRPDNDARLAAVLDAADSVSGKLNAASDKVQAMRAEADTAIGKQVSQLNNGLSQVQQLNYKINQAQARGEDPSSMMDLRQQTIDQISSIVPMRQVDRDHGMIALFTTGGAVVLDGQAAKIGFSPVGVIVPEMTQDSGALSGLTVNGKAVHTAGDRSPIQGGSLAGLFEVRDDLAVTAQTRLDAFSRDLVERFQDPGVDSTLSAGDAGLFTDAGAGFDTADEVGLSARLVVNARADPSKGGGLWRLRDGLGAASPGEAGDSTLLQNLSAALTAGRVASSGDFSGIARSANGLAADLLGQVSSERTAAETSQSFAVSMQDDLTAKELQTGVDTDREMQKLMLIQQAYAANAKVIVTVGEMVDTLMRL